MLSNNAGWESLESEIILYSAKGWVAICGDLNARTGTLKGYVSDDTGLPISNPFLDTSAPVLYSR